MFLSQLTPSSVPAPKQRDQLFLTVGIGLSFALLAFFLVRAQEQERHHLRFDRDAREIAAAVMGATANNLIALPALAAFHTHAEAITRKEFHAFTQPLLKDLTGIQALAWAPIVPAGSRPIREMEARLAGLKQFHFTEPAGDGKLASAAPRAQYVPIYFLEPLAGNEPLLGFDLASSSAHRIALEKTAQTGEPQATAPLPLISGKEARKGVILLQAIRPYGPDSPVAGYTMITLNLERILEKALLLPPNSGDFHIHLFDVTNGSPQPIAHWPAGVDVEADGPFRLDTPLEIGGRRWIVRCDSGPRYLAQQPALFGWLLPFIILSFTGALLHWQLNRIRTEALLRAANADLDHRVRTRTGTLEQLNLSLAAEIETRRLAEERASKIAENFLDGIITINAGGRIAGWNPRAESIFGWNRDEVLGRPLAEIIIPEKFRAAHTRGLAHYLATGEGPVLNTRLELPALHRLGYEFPIELAITPYRTSEGQFFLGFIRDLTEKKKAEQSEKQRTLQIQRHQTALATLARIAEENLTLTLENITETTAATLEVERVSIWLFNPDCSALLCQNLYLRAQKRHAPGGRLDIERFPAYIAALLTSDYVSVDQARTDPRTREFTESYLVPNDIHSMLDSPLRLHGKVSGVLCIEHTGTPRVWRTAEWDFASAVSNLIALALETDERRKAETELRRHRDELEILVEERTGALRRSEEFFRTITENATDLIAIVDLNGRRIFNSPSYQRLLGYTPEELHATTSLDQVHPDDREKILTARQLVQRSFQTGAIEYRMRHKDGSWRYLESHGTLIPGLRGGPAQILVVARDITERRQVIEAQREQAYQAGMAELAISVLHNIGNAVHSLADRARSLKEEGAELMTVADILDRCRHELDAPNISSEARLAKLPPVLDETAKILRSLYNESLQGRLGELQRGIQHIAEIVRIQQSSTKGGLMSSTFPLEEVAHDVFELMGGVLAQHHILPRVSITPEIGPVTLPRNQLMQALLNLVKNAAEAIADRRARAEFSAEIRLSAQLEPDGQVQLRVADNGCGVPPEQLKELFRFGFTTKPEGSGFGLHSAATTIQSLGGQIAVESDGKDRGAVFKIWLPRTSAPPK